MDQLRYWFPNYDKDLDKVLGFWQGDGRYLISAYAEQYSYAKEFNDHELLKTVPKHLAHQSRLPGLNLPSFYPDWGTVSIAKHWGGQTFYDSTEQTIGIKTVAKTIDEALAITPLPVDDVAMDARHAVQLYQQLCQQFATDILWMRTPELISPLNTATMLIGYEEFVSSMHTAPAKTHALLEKITNFLIAYVLYLRWECKSKICGNLWPPTFLPSELGVVVVEDLMAMLSIKDYHEFGLPYLRKLQNALGSLQIHCHGDWGRHVRTFKDAELKIRAVDFHHPDTRLEEMMPLIKDTILIPCLVDKQNEFPSLTEYYLWLLKNSDKRCRFWFIFPENTPGLPEFIQKAEKIS